MKKFLSKFTTLVLVGGFLLSTPYAYSSDMPQKMPDISPKPPVPCSSSSEPDWEHEMEENGRLCGGDSEGWHCIPKSDLAKISAEELERRITEYEDVLRKASYPFLVTPPKQLSVNEYNISRNGYQDTLQIVRKNEFDILKLLPKKDQYLTLIKIARTRAEYQVSHITQPHLAMLDNMGYEDGRAMYQEDPNGNIIRIGVIMKMNDNNYWISMF